MKKKKISKIINLKFILIVALFVFLDQISKFFIRTNMYIGKSIPLFENVLHMTYVTNTGISFGMLKGNNFLFIIISIAVFIFFILNIKEFTDSKLGAAFIFSGIIGNVTDRIFLGSVVDFIDFRVFPIFNFADSFINIGVFLIVLSAIREYMKQKKKLLKTKS
ncbi:signal peptidase II [archaeon]|jgi:signal peptidase II|nr:signal peptidase II [archaeon]MBT4351629.1 signal peptidase II [archaeon]MBT4647935.1 signal peptidase II [archaeon]MBT7393169.1 signal peptidase II [archaeon]